MPETKIPDQRGQTDIMAQRGLIWKAGKGWVKGKTIIRHWKPRGYIRNTCGISGYSTWYRPDVTCKRCKKIMKKSK